MQIVAYATMMIDEHCVAVEMTDVINRNHGKMAKAAAVLGILVDVKVAA